MEQPGTMRTLMFCLESKIRHSTIRELGGEYYVGFCLESKIRHSTIP